MKFLAAVFVLIGWALGVESAAYNVNWKTGKATLPTLNLKVGDTITYTWSGSHNVKKSTSGCAFEGSVLGSKSPYKYTATALDVGTV
jgi:plastocyanin